MTHPIFRKEIFVETAFEKRFQAMLRSAWHKRSWHVIVADPGAGKTMGIRDMIKMAGSKAVLAVTALKNDDEELALGNQFFSALGLPRREPWSHMVGSCGSSLTTNAKRLLPILDNDGPRGERTGMLSSVKEDWLVPKAVKGSSTPAGVTRALPWL